MKIGFYFFLTKTDEYYDEFLELNVEHGEDLDEACREWLDRYTSLDKNDITGFNEISVGPPMNPEGEIHVDGEIDVSPDHPGEAGSIDGGLGEEPSGEFLEEVDPVSAADNDVVYVYGNEYHGIDEFRDEANKSVKTECGTILGRGDAKEKGLVKETVERCPDCYSTGRRRAPGGNKKHMKRQELIQELKRLREELGKVPSTRDMDQHGRSSASTYKRHFDSWNAALEEAGFPTRNPPHNEQTYTKDDLVNWIAEYKEEQGRWPTNDDVDRDAPFSADLVHYKLGGLNKAIERVKRTGELKG